MYHSHDEVSYFARTNFRTTKTMFGIRQANRLFHVYIVGQTGVGKSTLIERLATQDLHAGRGFALIDPHGDLVEHVWSNVPEQLRYRVSYLNAPDSTQPFGYNPLRHVQNDRIPLAASGVLDTLHKMWPEAWGVRMEHVLRNTLYALLERESSTLPDILRLYADERFRRSVVAGVRNESVRRFWNYEFENYPWRLRAEAVVPIQNKLSALLSDPMLFRTLVQPAHDIHFRRLMDDGGALLVNLAKGRIGEDSAVILGSLLVSTIGLAALTRADMPIDARKPFFLYIDEFQSFTTLAFVNMMAELRKYGLGLTLAHQHLRQLDADIRHAVFGNAGTHIIFRVGPEDAAILAKQFEPRFDKRDLMNLPNHNIYLRMMIDGAPSEPFSARTLGSPDVELDSPTSYSPH